ncbi:MAG: hypothetical protein ACHREM_25795 [Polyangiales bacterium]
MSDLADLSRRCTAGMQQIVPPVKHTFKEGEVASFPVPFPIGCFRVIAVGGAGVKDVDLVLKDGSGKIVAADLTPDDVFPMIHPNKELCIESFQFLTMSMLVKKGSGEVAGGVWKRP